VPKRWPIIATAIYAAAIILSNVLINHIGISVPGTSVHILPVGFGLYAPSGVWAAAVSFPARDYVQRLGGRSWGVVAILLGGLVSWFVSDPRIAVASAATYLISESVDMLVYTPLQRRFFTTAVLASGLAAVVIDSVVFLHLAGIPAPAQVVAGLILGKIWVILAAGPVTYLLRKRLPAPCTDGVCC
jgi:queuosine precursor transporter